MSTQRLLSATAILVAVVAAVWLRRPATEWLRVDSCSDLGGQWDSAGSICQLPRARPSGRLVLREAAARELGLVERELVQADSTDVPVPVRAHAGRLRSDLSGGDTAVWYYVAHGGQYAALIPSYSFEGEEPRAVAAFGPDGRPLGGVVLPAYVAVERYCPSTGDRFPGSSARDSTDGCRYFFPPVEEPAPGRAAGDVLTSSATH